MKNVFPLATVDLARPGIVVDGVWHPPVAYTSYFPQTEFYRAVAGSGIHLYCFPAYLAGRGINIHSGIGPFRDGLWKGKNDYDFSDITEDMENIQGRRFGSASGDMTNGNP